MSKAPVVKKSPAAAPKAAPKPPKAVNQSVVVLDSSNRRAKSPDAATCIIIKKAQFGTPLLGSTAYELLDICFNPGNATLLPREAKIASTFQEWRARSWKLEFEPIASVFGGSKSGKVIMSLLNNAYDAPPDSAVSQSERGKVVTAKPLWESQTLICPPTKWLYVRAQAGSQGQDMRLDDQVFEIGIEGCDATVVGQPVGYFYLTAEIELRTPYTPSLQFAPRTNTLFGLMNTTDQTLITSPAGQVNAVNIGGSTNNTLLDNSWYSGATRASVTSFALAGGTYEVDFASNVSCLGVGTILLEWRLSGGSQLLQPELTGVFGSQFIVPASQMQHVYAMCIVTVQEASVASLTLNANCVQAASAPMIIGGSFIRIRPH